MKPSFFQSAQDFWPEDEAALVLADYRRLCAAYPEGKEDNEKRLEEDCLHLEQIFMRETDGAKLCVRFRAAITKGEGTP